MGMGAGAEGEQPRSVVGGVQLRIVVFVHECVGDCGGWWWGESWGSIAGSGGGW